MLHPVDIVLLAVPASGEFYKYVDKQGNIHFTDDWNQVPPDQRDSVETRVESESDTNIEQNDSAEEPTDAAQTDMDSLDNQQEDDEPRA